MKIRSKYELAEYLAKNLEQGWDNLECIQVDTKDLSTIHMFHGQNKATIVVGDCGVNFYDAYRHNEGCITYDSKQSKTAMLVHVTRTLAYMWA